MLDINKLVETIILDRNPKTKIRSNSSNDGMPRFANISLALLRHGNIIKRRKLLLKATFDFFKTSKKKIFGKNSKLPQLFCSILLSLQRDSHFGITHSLVILKIYAMFK